MEFPCPAPATFPGRGDPQLMQMMVNTEMNRNQQPQLDIAQVPMQQSIYDVQTSYHQQLDNSNVREIGDVSSREDYGHASEQTEQDMMTQLKQFGYSHIEFFTMRPQLQSLLGQQPPPPTNAQPSFVPEPKTQRGAPISPVQVPETEQIGTDTSNIEIYMPDKNSREYQETFSQRLTLPVSKRRFPKIKQRIPKQDVPRSTKSTH